MTQTTNPQEGRKPMKNAFARISAALLSILLAFAAAPSAAQVNPQNVLGSGNLLATIRANLAKNGGNLANNGHNKIAADLANILNNPSILNGKTPRWVKPGSKASVIILAQPGSDTNLTSLRANIAAQGGVVGRRFKTFPGLVVNMPLARLAALSQRPDVWRIVPNRPV